MRLLVLISIMLLLCVSIVSSVQLAISPVRYEQQHVLPGTRLSTSFYIQIPKDNNMLITYRSEGELAPWMTVNLSSSPQSTSNSEELVLSIDIPKNFSVRNYTSVLYVQAQENSLSSQKIIAQIPLYVKVGLTSQYFEKVQISDINTIENQSESIFFTVENQGNVALSSLNVSVAFRSVDTQELLLEKKIVHPVDVSPYSTSRQELRIDSQLRDDYYYADVTFVLADHNSSDTVLFYSDTLNPDSSQTLTSVIALVLLVVLVLFAVVKKK